MNIPFYSKMDEKSRLSLLFMLPCAFFLLVFSFSSGEVESTNSQSSLRPLPRPQVEVQSDDSALSTCPSRGESSPKLSTPSGMSIACVNAYG